MKKQTTPTMLPVLVHEELVTSTSDVTDETGSGSVDDGADGVSSHMTSASGKGVTMEQRLYVINRAGTGEASYLLVSADRQHIVSYRLRTEIWKQIEDVCNFGVAVVQNQLYVIGGFDRRHATHLSRVLRYDPAQGTWTKCGALNTGRAKFGVCTAVGKIYVCGGEKKDGRLTSSCEMYDPETDSWVKAGMLPSPRANPACAAHRKEVYCAGGYHGQTSHKNLWMYEGYKWGEVDEHYPHLLPTCLDRCAVASHDNTFYFIGGVVAKSLDKEGRPRLVTERRVFSYSTAISALSAKGDSHMDALTSKSSDLISPWNHKLSPMIYARHSAGAVTLGHKIYVVGGSELETGRQVRVAEYLDTRTGFWEEDFNFRKGDVSNVSCVLLAVPRIPVSERKVAYRLRWVMW